MLKKKPTHKQRAAEMEARGKYWCDQFLRACAGIRDIQKNRDDWREYAKRVSDENPPDDKLPWEEGFDAKERAVEDDKACVLPK